MSPESNPEKRTAETQAERVGGKEVAQPERGILIKRQGANLPHWTRDGAAYAVTFRLADSLPQPILAEWVSELERLHHTERLWGRPLAGPAGERLRYLLSEKVEAYLNAGHGACWMRQPEVARMVANGLKHFHGQRYRLIAWCVMPNHVHVVVQPLTGHPLASITHTWKSFTALQANRLLNRSGAFWEAESYDHLIRHEADLMHAIHYVLNNPRQAGLKAYPWVEVDQAFR